MYIGSAVLITRKLNVPNAQPRIGLLVLDELLVSLSPLFLEYKLHRAFGVLDDRGVHAYSARWGDDRVPAQGVFTRAELVDGGERNNVADFGVAYPRDGEQVAGGQNVFSATESRDYVSGGLRAYELKSGGG
jgi:hypothetical protein